MTEILKYLKLKMLKLRSPWQCKFNTLNYKYSDIVIVKLKVAYFKKMNKIETPN